MTKPNVTAFVYDKKGALLSVGRNSYVKTHPLQAKAAKAVGMDKRIYLHAEVHALVQIKDWSEARRIVVVRMDAMGNPVCARPCPICQFLIKKTGITRVEHT